MNNHFDESDADTFFYRPWPANGGYWEDDGFTYRACYRCGINMRLKLIKKTGGAYTYDKTEKREFCADCRHPAFLKPFFDRSYLDVDTV